MPLSVQEFMTRVVPWPTAGEPGVVNVHWKIRDGRTKAEFWGGRPQSTVESFLGLVQWANGRPNQFRDIYYCLSLQAEVGRYSKGKPGVMRSANNALALRSIWLDVDVKKPPKGYDTQREALAAVFQFCIDKQLPNPTAIVNSGGGFHFYWISDKPLTQDEWRPYAEGLKALAIEYGLRADYGVTTDPARILRIPGTFNRKDPAKDRPVELIDLKPQDLNFETQLAVLSQMTPASITATVTTNPPFDLSLFPPGQMHPLLAHLDPNESLAEGIEKRDYPPLDPRPVIKGCPFYRHMMLTHGKDDPQPLWNLAVLGTAFMEGGEAIAHGISNAYPTYSVEETHKLYERKLREHEEKGLGWPSCKAFEGEGCTQCATCPHKGKIKSPLNLALDFPPPNPDQITLQQIQANPLSQALHLPEGYGVDPRTGFICQIAEKLMAGGPPEKVIAPLFSCKLRAPWVDRAGVLHFEHEFDPNHWDMAAVLPADCVNQNALLSSLARSSCRWYGPNEQKVRSFIMSWKDLILKDPAQTSVPYGWWHTEGDAMPHGFVYGGVLRKDDGTNAPAGYIDPELAKQYSPSGKAGPWFECLKLITGTGRPDHELLVATSFAAPLIKFTGENSCVFSAWGTTGAGKSTAVKLATAVWGNPRYKENFTASGLGLLKKIGQLGNLPMYWDEINDHPAMDKVYRIVFDLTEGSEGTKLNQDRSMRERGIWQTLLLTASNISLFDHMVTKQKDTTAGLVRAFEFIVKMYPSDHATHDVSLSMQNLQFNYGCVGDLYAELLARDPAGVAQVCKNFLDQFDNALAPQQEERFWTSAAAAVMAGATLANVIIGDKAPKFDLPAIKDYLVETFYDLRERTKASETSGGTAENVISTLTQWLRYNYDMTLWTKGMHTGRGKPAAIYVLHAPERKSITTHFAVDPKVLYIGERPFREWMAVNNRSVTSVLTGLKTHFKMEPKRLRMGAGTQWVLPPERILVIPVPEGSELEDIMYAHTPDDEKPERIRGKSAEELYGPPNAELSEPVLSTEQVGIEGEALAQADKDLALVRSKT